MGNNLYLNRSIEDVIKEASHYFPVISVTAVSASIAIGTKFLLGDGIWQSLTEIAVCLSVSAITVLLLGMTRTEKKHFIETVFKYFKQS